MTPEERYRRIDEPGRSLVGQRLGPYPIQALLGAGGMGEVYRAHDPRLGRDVAIKVLPAHLAADAAALARFEREVRAVAALSHPNILAIHDFGTDRTIAYAVMELLEGETLRQRLAKGPLPWRKAVRIAGQIAEGLAAAHAKGIVHRDLKPENVSIGESDQVKILDFGLARIVPLDSATTQTVIAATQPGTIMGTVGYLSPEQVRGEPAGPSSDIFAFGCVLYEMLSGRTPFARNTVTESLVAVLHDDPARLSEEGREVTPSLEAVVVRCLEKRVADRFQSASDLAFALRSTNVSSGDSGGRPRERRSTTPRIRALAVLPLDNLARDVEQDYFVDGMTEALITELAQIHALRVISRTSAMQYKGTTKTVPQIARELGVDGIVEGSVMRAGDRVRITAQLIHAASDGHLWARSYERDLRDILQLQSEVSRAIADEVQTTLTPQGRARRTRTRAGVRIEGPTQPRAVDPEAYQLYLKGRYCWNKTTLEGLLKGIEYLQQAIDKDPSYAPAHAWLANCYGMLAVNYATPHEAAPKAKAAALTALALDSSTAEAHVSIAAIEIFYEWDWPRAGHHLERAVALSPSYAFVHNLYAYYHELMGDSEAALAAILRAQELDPLALLINIDVGIRYYHKREYIRAIQQYRETLEMDPGSKIVSYFLWLAYEQQGDYASALAELDKLTQAAPERGGSSYAILTREGYMAALREVLPQLQGPRDRRLLTTADVAAIHALLGETDLAFESLDKAYRDRDSRLPFFVKLDPRFDSLRPDARFKELLRRMNLQSGGS